MSELDSLGNKLFELIKLTRSMEEFLFESIDGNSELRKKYKELEDQG